MGFFWGHKTNKNEKKRNEMNAYKYKNENQQFDKIYKIQQTKKEKIR